MPKWMDIVGNVDFGEDSRKEVVLRHVEEVAQPGEESEGMLDVVGMGGGRQHEGRLGMCPVGEAVLGVSVIEVDKEFTKEGREEDFGVCAAVVSEAGVGEVDRVWGVGTRNV